MHKPYETFGNYILLEKLASGGMAEVYLAKKIAASGVQKFVAIKRILQQFSDSEDFIQMFKDEAKIAVNLSHSNVVSIYDFGIQEGQFFIVMEFVEGRNLRQILNRMKKGNKYFSISQVVHVIKQVASGLDHAHRCIDPTTGQPLNIIHRDMSPQNVMLAFEGDSKVVDFGIAKAETQIESTRAGTLKGKFGYMSPEQVEGHAIDSRTDIFALGIMMWEMLANQRLFLANSEINTLRKIRECDVPSLRKINPNIPTELDQIVQKALKKDKSQRYQTAAELSRDLQGFISRFDPDFSVQDFSSFIKGIFSEEIIEIRKKQIIYSQVTVAESHNEFIERTEVVTNTDSTIIDELSEASINDMALNTITKSNQAQSQIVRMKKVAGLDFSNAGIEVTSKGTERFELIKREAHENTKNYKQNTYTNTEHTLTRIKKKNNDMTLLTIIFALSFVLVAIAVLNQSHPGIKDYFCNSLESFGLCSPNKSIGSNTLSVQSAPLGASVYINKRFVGKTPIDVRAKDFPIDLSLKLPGHKTISTSLNSMPDGQNLSFNMKKVPTGILIVKSVGSEIYVNDYKVKSGQRISVQADTAINVRVINPLNGRSTSQQAFVRPGLTSSIIVQPPQ